MARKNSPSRQPDPVEPVRFLGTTWVDQGPSYWLRRAAMSLVYLLLFTIASGMSVGFYIGLVQGAPTAVRTAVGAAILLVILGTATYVLRSQMRVEKGLDEPASRGWSCPGFVDRSEVGVRRQHCSGCGVSFRIRRG